MPPIPLLGRRRAAQIAPPAIAIRIHARMRRVLVRTARRAPPTARQDINRIRAMMRQRRVIPRRVRRGHRGREILGRLREIHGGAVVAGYEPVAQGRPAHQRVLVEAGRVRRELRVVERLSEEVAGRAAWVRRAGLGQAERLVEARGGPAAVRRRESGGGGRDGGVDVDEVVGREVVHRGRIQRRGARVQDAVGQRAASIRLLLCLAELVLSGRG